jgi:toxin ParE1/3/4
MPKAIFTAEAEQDLGEIVDYIAQHNVLAAVSWLQETRAVCDLLAAQPGMGQRMQTSRFGEVRRHVIGNYLIYYQPGEIGIDVVRVVHGAREQGRLI